MNKLIRSTAILALALALGACSTTGVHPLVCITAGALAGGGAAYAASDENEGATALAAFAGAAVGGLLCREKELPKAAPVEPIAAAPAPAPAPVAAPPPPPPAPAQGTMITSLEGANFDFDKATLRPEAGPKLDRAVEMMNEHTGIVVNVEGHTDNVGSDAYNQALSERRAQAVVDYLVGRGIDGSRLRATGYGESRPAESNDTDAGRAQNRRVDLIVAE